MTGPEHYTAAEQHAAAAEDAAHSGDAQAATFFLGLAGVHATLAVAAATAFNDGADGMGAREGIAWLAAAGPARPNPGG